MIKFHAAVNKETGKIFSSNVFATLKEANSSFEINEHLLYLEKLVCKTFTLPEIIDYMLENGLALCLHHKGWSKYICAISIHNEDEFKSYIKNDKVFDLMYTESKETISTDNNNKYYCIQVNGNVVNNTFYENLNDASVACASIDNGFSDLQDAKIEEFGYKELFDYTNKINALHLTTRLINSNGIHYITVSDSDFKFDLVRSFESLQKVESNALNEDKFKLKVRDFSVKDNEIRSFVILKDNMNDTEVAGISIVKKISTGSVGCSINIPKVKLDKLPELIDENIIKFRQVADALEEQKESILSIRIGLNEDLNHD